MALSLKGITCTNDYPNLCAVCSAPFPEGRYSKISVLAICCGKRACLECKDSGAFYDYNVGRCCLCATTVSTTNFIGYQKKQAKKGRPWAQFTLGRCFGSGDYVAQSHFDAMRWYRKAAAQGHPEAYLCLACQCCIGDGCAKDLAEARGYAEKSMLLDDTLVDDARNLLIAIGWDYVMLRTEEATKEAKSILMPLAEAGISDAQHNLGGAFFYSGDFSSAEQWFVAAALQGDADASYSAMECCVELGKVAQSKYWLGVATKRREDISEANKQKQVAYMDETWVKFRKLRDSCGGCGAELDGAMRKICKQCKTYCYCGRECQKLHWNRQGEGGHRDDCMRVLDLREQMKKVRAEKKSSSGD